MRQCPRCGSYMTPYIQYNWDGGRVFYTCDCGYSTKLETLITSNRTFIDQSEFDLYNMTR